MRWKRFRVIASYRSGGYIVCRTIPPHPLANAKGVRTLHRVKMENRLKRFLRRDEVIHHKNENKQDNRLCNLQLLSPSEHTRLHTRVTPTVYRHCPICDSIFMLKRYDYEARMRYMVGEDRRPTCSRSCGSQMAQITMYMRKIGA